MRFSVRVKTVNWLAVLCSVTRSIFVCVSERPHSLVFFAPLYEFPVWVMPTLRSAARQSCRDRYFCVLYYRYIVFINVQSTANYGILLCRFFSSRNPCLIITHMIKKLSWHCERWNRFFILNNIFRVFWP